MEQKGLPMDTTSTGLNGKLPSADTPMTELEKAAMESAARKIEAEETKRQGKLL